jgi:hypothetical protein
MVYVQCSRTSAPDRPTFTLGKPEARYKSTAAAVFKDEWRDPNDEIIH